MFGSTVIDIAIGLVFVYLLLSLICSAINEILERFTRYRAKDLHRGLQELFRDRTNSSSPEEATSPPSPDDNWVRRLYNHPLIWGLFEGKYEPGAKNLPSYIPATTFALSLMDLIAPGQGSNGATAGTTTATPGVVVNVAEASPPAEVPDPLKQLRAGIEAIPSEHVRQALQTLVNAAGNDAAKARENIEGWFNSSMDRVSGWYKRRSQLIVLVSGLVLAAALNADTVAIVRVLSTDRTMRESLVAAAETYAKNQPAPQTAQPPASPAPAPASTTSVCVGANDTPECRIKENLQEIKKLGLPIGWTQQPDDPRSIYISTQAWAVRGVGWLITAFAVSLGAPFWFDLLNKFVVIRSTVKPREKSPDEPSKG